MRSILCCARKSSVLSRDRLEAAAREVWALIRPHVEWADGFSLVLLYSESPVLAEAVRRRADEGARMRTRRLEVLAPAGVDELDRQAFELLRPRGLGSGGVWIDLARHVALPGWTDAVGRLLVQLNRRRAVLERDVRVPVVLVLPASMRASLTTIAPDLWVIRSVTAELRVSLAEEQSAPEERMQPLSVLDVGPADALEREWAELIATDRLIAVDARRGLHAYEAARDRGDVGAALRVAIETLRVFALQTGRTGFDLAEPSIDAIRAFAEDAESTAECSALVNLGQALRGCGRTHDAEPIVNVAVLTARRLREVSAGADEARLLSISLDTLGVVRRDLGGLAAARHAFRESLDITRSLRTSLGDAPQVLRDLAISLHNLGKLERELGNPDIARDAFREGLDIRRSLRTSLGDAPQVLRDLSVSLDDLGNLERDIGNLEAARDAFRESLELSRILRTGRGESPQVLRDLSVSLNNVGNLERESANLEAAREAFRESLELTRILCAAMGETPWALRDLSVSLNNLGNLERDSGNFETARDTFRESLQIARLLRAGLGESPQALRDLSISLNNLGNLERDLGNFEPARAFLRESLHIRRLTYSAIGDSPQALADLSLSLGNLGNLECEVGNFEAARDAFRESLAVTRRLHAASGESPQVLRDLGIGLTNLGNLERQVGNFAQAYEAFRESLEIARRIHSAIDESPRALRNLALALTNVGLVHASLGDVPNARRSLREALDLSRRNATALADSPSASIDLAFDQLTLAEFELDQGATVEATALLDECAATLSRLDGVGDLGTLPRHLPTAASLSSRLAAARARSNGSALSVRTPPSDG